MMAIEFSIEKFANLNYFASVDIMSSDVVSNLAKIGESCYFLRYLPHFTMQTLLSNNVVEYGDKFIAPISIRIEKECETLKFKRERTISNNR